jgi:hypothetical protein
MYLAMDILEYQSEKLGVWQSIFATTKLKIT